MENIETIIAQQHEIALTFAKAFKDFGEGYKDICAAVRIMAEKSSEVKVKLTADTKDLKSVILDAEKPLKEEKAKELPEEKEVEEEKTEKKSVKTTRKPKEKLPSVAQLATAVSSVFVNLPKPINAIALDKMDKIFDDMGIESPEELAGKPESVKFLEEVQALHEEIQELKAENAVSTQESSVEKDGAVMDFEEFKKRVLAFVKSGDDAKIQAVEKAKEKYGVDKAQEVEASQRASFVSDMEEFADEEAF